MRALRLTARSALFLGAGLLAACSSGTAQTLPETLDAFAETEGFSGVLLVDDGDQTVARAYGQSNIEASAATALDTRYQLGSISKWLSSLVVLRLVDEGVLDLHAPISAILPDLPSPLGGSVTLHHLLTHTSGVPNQIVEAIQVDPSVMTRALPPDEAVRRYASGDLRFEPGSAFDYSHSNWILVQAIVEASTGQPFADVVDAQVVAPLGLTGTGAFGGDFDAVPGLAVGYETTGPSRERAPAAFPVYLTAAGGLYSTAPDLLALVDALYAGNLLSAASLEALDTVYVEDEMYAYGGRVRTMEVDGEAATVIWHSGSNGPSKSRLSRVLPDGPTVIALSNTGADSDATEAFTERIVEASAH